MTKRIIALLLALILTVGLLPTVALAAETAADTNVVSGSIGTDGKWSQTPPTQPKVDGVKTVDKTAEKVAGTDNQYKVTLTVVLEQTAEEQKPGAAATVLVLDTSGSMAYCAECGEEDPCEHTKYVEFTGTTGSKDGVYYYKNGDNYERAYYCDGSHESYGQKHHKDGWYKSNQAGHENWNGNELVNQKIYTMTRTSRLDAAKTAAQSFLKTYSGLQFDTDGKLVANQTARDLDRYVSVVTFADGVTLQKDWLDVSDPTNYTAVLSALTSNSLTASGATNLDAGLTYAEYLLKQNTVKDAAKNVIALTDGEPTYYLYSDNNGSVRIGNKRYSVAGAGNCCGEYTKASTDDAANAIKQNDFADLYTICFGVAEDKMKLQWNDSYGGYWSYWNITVGQYLQSIASNKAGKKFAYSADNAEQLNTAFAAITDTIVSGLDTGTVNDTLPTGITATDKDDKNISSPMTWKLDSDDFNVNVVESTKNEDSKKVTTYTYTKTYYVTIDPDAEGLETTKIGDDLYAPLNGETTLTVEVAGKKETIPFPIPFPIPAGKVTPTTFTVTWKSQDGNTELEKDEKVAKNSKPSFDKTEPTKTEDDMFTYTFAGWATSANQESGTPEADLPNVTADVTYYAAFSKTQKQYTVTGTIDNNGTVTNTNQKVDAGTRSTAMDFTPAAGYEIDEITVKIGDAEPATITFTGKNNYTYPAQDNVKANITVTVKTKPREDLKYVVKHVEKDNETNVLDTESKTGTLNAVINGEEQKKTFPGFSYDGCSPASITISANEDANLITLYYTRNKHKVTYTYTGNVPQGLTPPPETEYDFGANVKIENAPTAVPGYTFEGWKRGTADATDFTMPDEDVTITGNWTKNADAGYTIEYYLETLTEGTFEKDDNLTISGRTGTIDTTASVTEADKKQITGFTYDVGNAQEVLSGTILEDGSLTLKLYYTRNSYTVKYEYTGTDIPQDATALPADATYKYGAEVTVAAAATSADYVFSGWGTKDASINNGKFVMPAKNVTITGNWTQATYDVNLSPYVKKTLKVDGTLPSDFTFEVEVTVDEQRLQQKGTVTMTAAGTSSFNMPTVTLTKGMHMIMVQEVVDNSTKNSNIEYDTDQKTFVLNIPTSGAAAPVQYGMTDSDGHFVEVKEPAFVTITNKYTQPTKSFDLNTLVIKKFVLADNSKPIPTGEGISYTFSVAVTPLDDNGERDWDNGFTGVVTLYGENTTGVSFDFGANQYLTFDTSGEHRYVVSEIPSALSNVIYDKTAYLLTLSVKDDLSIVPTITDYTEEASTLSLGEIVPATNKITFTNKYSEKQDPGKLTINFANFVKKELTATGTKTASDVDFTVDVKEFKTVISSIQGEEEVNTYAGEQLLSTTLNAHFDSITGGETKTAPFNGSIVVEHAGVYSFDLTEVDGQRTGVTYDKATYKLWIYVNLNDKTNELYISGATAYKYGEEGQYLETIQLYTTEGALARNDNYLTFHNTIDTGKDDYYPIIIPTIIGKDTGMLNKTDHFAYVIGYPDGTVHPNGQITRAEVATIFFRLLRDEVRDGAFTTSNTYSDVAYGKWYNNPISTMSALGIITGYPDGTFKPDKPITRAEFAAIAARFDETQSGKSATFSDVIGHWAAKEIGIAYYNDWIKGYPDGTFKPDQNITRAEAMTLINRVLERKPESPADLLTDMNTWTDNLDTSKWYYLDVQEATNSHGYTRKTFNYELWRQMLPDPDWSRYER